MAGGVGMWRRNVFCRKPGAQARGGVALENGENRRNGVKRHRVAASW